MAVVASKFLVCPETIVFRVDLCFADIYFFSHHDISELCWPFAAKFSTMIESMFR